MEIEIKDFNLSEWLADISRWNFFQAKYSPDKKVVNEITLKSSSCDGKYTRKHLYRGDLVQFHHVETQRNCGNYPFVVEPGPELGSAT